MRGMLSQAVNNQLIKLFLIIDRLVSICRLCGNETTSEECCTEKRLFCANNVNNGQDLAYECTSCRECFTSSGRRRAHKCGEVRLEASAVDGYFRVYNLVIISLPSPDFFNILIDSKSRIVVLLGELLNEFGALKFYMSIEMEFIEAIGDKKIVQHFTTRANELLASSIIDKAVMEHLLKLTQRVDDFISLGSGWIVSSLNTVKLNVTPFNLHRAGSYIETPHELASKKRCLLNIVNRSDHLCFLWSIIADDHHLETSNPSRKEFYRRFMNEHDVTGIKFPMSLDDISSFEDLNGRGVNVLGWKKKYGFYTERRSPKDKFPKVTNLLRITDHNLNFHYILITNLPRLLCVAKNSHMHFVCLGCHTLKASQGSLDEHKKSCDKQGLQTVYFPKEKYLEFTAFRKTVSVPVWVILDLESTLVPEERSIGKKTTVISKHVACSYALKVKSVF